MSSQDSKEITIALATYLPNISISMNKMIGYLQVRIEGSEDISETAFAEMLHTEMPSIIQSIKSIHKEIDVTITVHEGNAVLVKQCLFSFNHILTGLQLIMKWLNDENHPEENLKNAVDSLFTGGQLLLSAIGSMTDNEQI